MADTMGMGGGYSLSDLSAVLGKDGAFGGGSGSWLVMLLIFFLFFRNGNGFGDFGNVFGNVATPAATQESVRSILEGQSSDRILDAIQGNSAAISQLAQSTGFSFDQMNQAVNGVKTAILETANATNLSIKDLGTQIAMNNGAVLSALQNACCTVGQKITDTANQINMNIFTGINSLDKTLCDIKGAVNADFAQLQYQAEKNASAVIQAGNANTDKILQYLTTDKIANLNTELALCRAEISQRNQTDTLLSQLKGSCGCGCGCGNSCNC